MFITQQWHEDGRAIPCGLEKPWQIATEVPSTKKLDKEQPALKELVKKTSMQDIFEEAEKKDC